MMNMDNAHLDLIEQQAHQVSLNFRNRYRRPKPNLDQSDRDRIVDVLVESLGLHCTVHLRLYHEFEDCVVIGVIDKINPYTRLFLVDGEWFNIEDVIKATIET
ncbi:YolD-like family protein [Paenibacillus sp. BC26]|uniref:YolD-like family protein n=1 Tax=Paenibacillus sp. BC26 TaxID=1881032 RepID=UPI001160BDAC